MVAGWLLVIIWRFYHPGWAGDYGGWLASSHCLEVLLRWLGKGLWWLASCYYLEVISPGLGGGLWWLAGFLLLSEGSITLADRRVIVAGWPLVIVWRFYYAGWPGIMVAGWLLVIIWRFYHPGWAGNYDCWLASCYCLEVLLRWLTGDYGGWLLVIVWRFYYAGWPGVMVAGWPLVIIWRFYHTAGRGIMVASWSDFYQHAKHQ